MYSLSASPVSPGSSRAAARRSSIRPALRELLAAATATGALTLLIPTFTKAAEPEEEKPAPVDAIAPLNTASTLDTAAPLATVVISATRRAQPIADVQASVQVIDRQDLEAYSGTSVTEALRQAVGVDARPLGSNSSVSVRGFSLNPGALLVDGMRRPGKYGGINPSLFGLENLDRIEVVRGPMSALYGADATGGAINLISRSPLRDKSLAGGFRLMGGATDDGQRRTHIGGAMLGFGGDELRHRVSVEHRGRGLFRYDDGSPTTDLNRLQQTYASYEGAYRLTADHSLRWTLEYTDQDDTGPGLLTASATQPAQAYTTFERERRWFGAVRYRGAVGPGVLEADLGYGSTDASTTRSYPTIEHTDYRQSQGQMRYAFELGSHSLLFGGGFVRDDIDVTINRGSARRSNTYLLAQDEWSLPARWKLLAGLRHDHFTDFGSVTTPRISLQRALGPWRVRIGYGEAYRAPSVLEQHSSFTRATILIVGNPDLKPETNKSWEAALSYHGQAFNADAVYYRSRVSDLISTVSEARQPDDPSSIRSRARYVNVARADLEGLELSGAWRTGTGWSLLVGWEYQDARDGTTGARLTEHARQIARAGLRWERGRWRTDLLARYDFDYYAADPGARGSAPFDSNYGTTDIKLRYQATGKTSLAFGIDNLFARRQPINFSARGSTFDPPARFLYLELHHAL
ncbi:MAG: TonB-dependent receptor [Burkholderiaceae bacterium]